MPGRHDGYQDYAKEEYDDDRHADQKKPDIIGNDK